MSAISPAKLNRTNTSTHSWGSDRQPGHGPASRFAMDAAELVGLRAELDGLREHRVGAVPLHEIGAAHERTVFRRAAVVVPEIEIDEIDWRREWRAGQDAVLPKRGHDVRRGLDLRVGGHDHVGGLR